MPRGHAAFSKNSMARIGFSIWFCSENSQDVTRPEIKRLTNILEKGVLSFQIRMHYETWDLKFSFPPLKLCLCMPKPSKSWYLSVFFNGTGISLTLRIMGSQNWWFGDPRTLQKTHPNPSFWEGPMILRACQDLLFKRCLFLLENFEGGWTCDGWSRTVARFGAVKDSADFNEALIAEKCYHVGLGTTCKWNLRSLYLC